MPETMGGSEPRDGENLAREDGDEMTAFVLQRRCPARSCTRM